MNLRLMRYVSAGVLVALMAACSKSPSQKIVGTWEMTDMGMTLQQVFNADGTITLGPAGGTGASGTYTVSGDTLTVAHGSSSDTFKIDTLDDTTLVLEQNKAGNAVKTTWKRK